MPKVSDAKTTRESGKFTYQIEGHDPAVLSLPSEVLALPEWAFNALHFALKTAARNATAGFLKEDPKKAAERIAKRFETWVKGEWKASGSTGEAGERTNTILARALARVLNIEVDDAADQISDVIRAAIESAGLDPDTQEPDEKKKVVKIATDTRNQLRDDPAVIGIYKQIQVEEAQKRATEAAKAKPTESKLAELLKR